MKITSEVVIHETDGFATRVPQPSVIVKSHPEREYWVVIEVGGTSYTVAANHMERAIKNATNWR